MSPTHIGPVFSFTPHHASTAKFYADLLGLTPSAEPSRDASWLNGANADVVFHAPDDPETPGEVRAQMHFVVWFGVDDIRAAYDRARAANAVVGEFQGDYFFARDPEGRYIGIHVSEEHAHGHDHEH